MSLPNLRRLKAAVPAHRFPAASTSPRAGLYRSMLFTSLCTVALAIVLTCHLRTHTKVVIDNLSQCLGPFIAAVWCLVSLTYRTSAGRARLSWTSFLFSMGALSYAVGQMIWTYYELVLHKATPFPSWADVGFLLAYPFLFTGVLSLPTRAMPIATRLRVLLDGTMVIAGLATFSWYFVLGPTLMQGSETMLAKVIGTAYPASDLILLVCVFMLFFRAGGGIGKTDVGLLTMGIGAIIASDTVFDIQTLHNTYQTGHLIDIGWLIGYMLVAFAGDSVRNRRALDDVDVEPSTRAELPLWNYIAGLVRRVPSTAPALLPYLILPAVAALVWHTLKTRGDEALESGVYGGAGFVLLLLFVRQLLAIVENQHLAAQLRAFNAGLEEQVRDRTAQLALRTEQIASLQRLTAAVNESLSTEQVLLVALRHAPEAAGVDAVAIRLTDRRTVSTHGFDTAVTAFERAAEIAETQTVDIDGGRCLVTPLYRHDRLLGTIGFYRRDADFEPGDVDVAHAISLQIVGALQNAQQYNDARDAADRDSVTGLYNHRAIHRELDVALEQANVDGDPVSVVMTDMDNFKLFNDTYGHPIGDKVLHSIGRVLSEEIGDNALVGRYGGDEFLIILPRHDGRQAVDTATRLRNRILEETFQYSEDERTIPLGMSFGIATYPLDSETRHDLLRTADSNLYTAKNSDERVVGLSEMQRAHRELRAHSSFRVLDGLLTAVDNKDRYTRRHSEDVTAYALWIATELEMSEEIHRILRVGGLLHDVGKIGVPDEILRKPSRLTDEEYDILKNHAELGALIVAGVPGMDDILDAVRHHHERFDGKGYPAGLKGRSIPLTARILAVADAVSAMTTDRPYRKGMPWEVAMDEVRRHRGTQFDPDLADAFLAAAKKWHSEKSMDTPIRIAA